MFSKNQKSQPVHENTSKWLFGCIFFICGLLIFKMFSIFALNFMTSTSDMNKGDAITLNIVDIPSNFEVVSDEQYLTSKLLGALTDPTELDESMEFEESDDPRQLIDLTDFEYLIHQPSCSEYQRLHRLNETLLTVILVHSAPNNIEKRQAIRETWGQSDPRSRLFFVLGAVNSTTLQNELLLENDEFQDVIQGNFIDTYRNLTYKHVMALKWFKDNCPEVKFLFRTDDDIMINMQTVYSFMETDLKESENLLVCHNRVNTTVHRGDRKWSVSKQEYAADVYPTYCYGFAIIYTNDVVGRIYREAQLAPYFWIDDVHVTGTLRARLGNVLIKSFEHFFSSKWKKISNLIDGNIDINDIKPKYIIIQPNLNEKKIRKLWNIVKEYLP